MTPRCSVILEYENATTHERDEVAPVFAALQRQFAGGEARAADDRNELILVYDPTDQDGTNIDRIIDSAAPGLRKRVDIHLLGCQGFRYYQLKNAGAEKARGEILVFLDSDLEPEDGWLDTLLAPFNNPATIAVNGYTFLGHYDFLSRTFALTWMFPLRNDDPREVQRRPLHANNWAVRRSWFARHPFPEHPGFKVSCSLLAAELNSEGVELVKVMAYGRHKPLGGWRFILWRAAAAGRDDDSRYATMRSTSRVARFSRAFLYWIKHLLRSVRRVSTHHRAVEMPIYEVLPAISVAWLYYTVFFVAQIGSALSGPRQESERIPDFVSRH